MGQSKCGRIWRKTCKSSENVSAGARSRCALWRVATRRRTKSIARAKGSRACDVKWCRSVGSAVAAMVRSMTETRFRRDVGELVGAAAIVATVGFSPVLAWRYRRWGATDEETAEALPGDALILAPRLQATRAIDIAASPDRVWPWIVQMGHGKAGLYSYERLENLIGCDIHNSSTIDERWQRIAVGDRVGLGPEGYPHFAVNEVSVNSHLVLLAGGGPDEPANSWAFVLRATANGSRLIVRSRYRYASTIGQRLIWRAITEPMHFVMERKMLLGIRDRAEGRTAASRA